MHRTDIVAGRTLTLLILDLHQAIARLLDIAFENVLAQLQQLILDRAFVEDEEHLGTVQRIDGLKGDLARIARPDTDQQQLFHCSSFHGSASRHCRPAEGQWQCAAYQIEKL
ncbi:hypothetical protein D3C76_1468340 [compost metagenome]